MRQQNGQTKSIEATGRFCDDQHIIKINGKEYLHDARKWQFAKYKEDITEDGIIKSNK